MPTTRSVAPTFNGANPRDANVGLKVTFSEVVNHYDKIYNQRVKKKYYLAIVAVMYTSSFRCPTGGFTDSPFTLTSCELRKGFTGNA